jgi:stage II sporulation protein AA (anti-sigma F factor antagonist)
MDVSTRYRGNVLVVGITGELDHHTADALRKVMEEELDKEIAHHVLLNLSGLQFMDSSGLGVILGRYRRINASGGRMAACSLNGHIAKVFELVGLTKILAVYDREESALSDLKQG